MSKKYQKMFYYSGESVKKFIERRIEEIANKTQRTSSFVIENLLMDGLLPKNKEAKHLILHKLYPEDGHGGVKDTLKTLFSNNAAGEDWSSRYSNFKPLVEYCMHFVREKSAYNGNKGDLGYLLSQLRPIVDRIENCANACIEPIDRDMYSSQSKTAKRLLEIAEETPEEIVFNEHFQLVYDCWDMLDDWSITYRYLRGLVVMCDFQENADAREKLCNIISQISEEW